MCQASMECGRKVISGDCDSASTYLASAPPGSRDGPAGPWRQVPADVASAPRTAPSTAGREGVLQGLSLRESGEGDGFSTARHIY